MPLSFSFETDKSVLLGTIYRPVVQVFFFSEKKNQWYESWMVVDTGADYTILPKYFSKTLGIDLHKDCKKFRTLGIGGSEIVYFLPKIKMKIGEWERVVPVGFLDKNDVPPLFGRHKLLETFEVLLSKNHTITFSP